MSGDILSDRRKAAEEAFFAKQNEELRQRLRTAGSQVDQPGSREGAPAVRLNNLDSGGETAVVLALVPLIAVAWADGTLDAKERAAVLLAAKHNGLDASGASYGIFERWLAEKPDLALLNRWTEYVHGLCRDMDDARREAFRGEVVGQACRVAETTGGLLGLGRVSGAETAVLEKLDAAFAP